MTPLSLDSRINKIGCISLMLLSLFASLDLMAKDISDEQYQVRLAQKEYGNANRDYEETAGQVEQYEKRIAQINTQMENLKKTLPGKKQRLDKAKQNLDEKTQILDKVWEENKK